MTGFTIVELLIVVVVIAILASITLVSYNGVRGAAENAAFLSDLDGIQDSLLAKRTVSPGEYMVDNPSLYSSGQVDAAGLLKELSLEQFAKRICVETNNTQDKLTCFNTGVTQASINVGTKVFSDRSKILLSLGNGVTDTNKYQAIYYNITYFDKKLNSWVLQSLGDKHGDTQYNYQDVCGPAMIALNATYGTNCVITGFGPT